MINYLEVLKQLEEDRTKRFKLHTWEGKKWITLEYGAVVNEKGNDFTYANILDKQFVEYKEERELPSEFKWVENNIAKGDYTTDLFTFDCDGILCSECPLRNLEEETGYACNIIDDVINHVMNWKLGNVK